MLSLLAKVNAAGAPDDTAASSSERRVSRKEQAQEEEIEDLRAQVSALREALAQEGARTTALEAREAAPPARGAVAGEDGWDLDFDLGSKSPPLKPEEQSAEAAASAASLKAAEQQLAEERRKTAEALHEVQRLQQEAMALRARAQQVPAAVAAAGADSGWDLDMDLDDASPEVVPSASGRELGEAKAEVGRLKAALAGTQEQLHAYQAEVARVKSQQSSASQGQAEIEALKAALAAAKVRAKAGEEEARRLNAQQAEAQARQSTVTLPPSMEARLSTVTLPPSSEARQSTVTLPPSLEDSGVDGWGDFDMDAELASPQAAQGGEEEVAKARAEADGLKAALSNTEEQMRAYQAEVQRLKGEEGKVAQAQTEAIRLKGALEATQAQLQAYQAEVVRLKAEEARAAQLQTEVARLQENAQRFQEADIGLSQSRAEIQRLQRAAEATEEQRRSLIADNARSHAEVAHLQRELARAQQEAASSAQQARREAQQSAQELQGLRQRLLGEEQACEQAQADAADMRKDIAKDGTLAAPAAGDVDALRSELALAAGRAAYAEGALVAERVVNGEAVASVLRRELDGLKAVLLSERRGVPCSEPHATKGLDVADLM